MIVVRNVFRLQFGEAREAQAVWKEGLAIASRLGYGQSRILSDLVGEYYTLVVETTFASLAEFDERSKKIMASEEWHAWYQKFLPLAEGGHREIFTIVE